jgi:hypothetical protein
LSENGVKSVSGLLFHMIKLEEHKSKLLLCDGPLGIQFNICHKWWLWEVLGGLLNKSIKNQ